MTYNAEVQFKFDATWTPSYSSSFPDDDFIPEEHYLITAPAADLNCKQYFKLFEKFLLCVGMAPETIRSSAMSLVFNDYVREEEQRKICKEYELTDQIHVIIEDRPEHVLAVGRHHQPGRMQQIADLREVVQSLGQQHDRLGIHFGRNSPRALEQFCEGLGELDPFHATWGQATEGDGNPEDSRQ